MALSSVLYDFQIALSNVDRSIEQQLAFKLARHPSEVMERVWLKVMAYCWLWEERLVFGPGLGDPDAPDLETRDYTNLVTRYVRVGRIEPLKLQKAVDQNANATVCMLFESEERQASFFIDAAAAKASRLVKAEFAALDTEFLRELSKLEERRQKLTVTLSGDHFYVDAGAATLDGPLVRGTFRP